MHLVSIPITNTSVNPARSTAVAFFHGGAAPAQLWLFWVVPVVGGLVAGATYGALTGEHRAGVDIAGDRDARAH